MDEVEDENQAAFRADLAASIDRMIAGDIMKGMTRAQSLEYMRGYFVESLAIVERQCAAEGLPATPREAVEKVLSDLVATEAQIAFTEMTRQGSDDKVTLLVARGKKARKALKVFIEQMCGIKVDRTGGSSPTPAIWTPGHGDAQKN